MSKQIIWLLHITQGTGYMPNIPLTHISVCERMSICSHTLMSLHCSVIALLAKRHGT